MNPHGFVFASADLKSRSDFFVSFLFSPDGDKETTKTKLSLQSLA